MNEIEQAVSNGVWLLDKNIGTDWIHRIKLNSLEMTDGCMCICGQLYGEYEDGCHELDLDSGGVYDDRKSAVHYGFIVNGGHPNWEALQDAWRTEILRLRKERDGSSKPAP